MPPTLFVAAAVVAGVLGPLVFLLQVWFLAELRRWERQEWLSVASPRWLDAGGFTALLYIQSGRYRRLGNARLRSLGLVLHIAQLLLVLLVVGFVTLIASDVQVT